MGTSRNTDAQTGRYLLLLVSGLFLGMIFGFGILSIIQGASGFLNVNVGEPSHDLSPGNYGIVAVVEKTDDHVLLVLRDEDSPGSEPRYHKIDANETINFDTDCCLAGGKVVKVYTDDLSYTKFVRPER